MKIIVSSILASFAAGMLLSAGAADYPTKPVRFILPLAAGGSTDIVVRIFAASLAQTLGQPFIVDNRPGAGGILAVEAVARAAPDGYTLLMCGVSQAIGPAFKRNLPYDPWRDFSRVAQFGAVANVLVVHPGIPAQNLGEFVRYAREHPGTLRYGSSGIGFTPHLTMELFKVAAGIDLLHVPYKVSSQAAVDVMGGQVHALFFNLPSQLPNIRSDKVRALAVTSLQRSTLLPEVPTVAESGYPGFEVTVWYGMCGPAGTPPAVLLKLEAAVERALAAPDLRRRFADHGVDPRPVGGAAFDRFYKSEVTRWAKVVRDAGVKPE